jgi:DNA polymerase III gamma/tau subunit
MNDLDIKYRPLVFEDVLGQELIVSSLKQIIESDKKLPPTLLFSGPSGIGKTTLARICAYQVGCPVSDIIEINAAKFTGIEDMREVIEITSFQSISGKRVIILDEAHRLSKNAFDSLLKSLEEPPKGTSWILCSTEPHKIPKSIVTRCHSYELKKVTPLKIKDLLTKIAALEGYDTDKRILNLIAIKSDGSPRQALKFLSMARGANFETVQELIKSGASDEPPNIINLCRVLAAKGPWAEAVAAIKDIETDNEGARLVIINYFNKCVLNSKTQENIEWYLRIIHAFYGSSFNPSEKQAPLLIGTAALLL